MIKSLTCFKPSLPFFLLKGKMESKNRQSFKKAVPTNLNREIYLYDNN